MKRLYLLRHATPGEASDDHERPLVDEGRREAAAAGEVLARQDPPPEWILCSTALRARETTEEVHAALPDAGVEYAEGLYLASAAALLAAVEEADDGHGTLVVVAHNPGIFQLAQSLIAASDPLRDQLQRFPPASLVGFEFGVGGWVEIATGSGRALLHWLPGGEAE